MNIRNRLTLQFTIITGVILLIVLSAVYFATTLITRNEFFDRLQERANIAAQIYFEQDELSKTNYEQFQEKFLKKLPDEVVQIFNAVDEKTFVENNPSTFYAKKIISKVREFGTYRYTDFDHQVIGEYYHDNQGDFVLFVSAKDEYGNERLKNLLWLLIVAFILAQLIIFFAGRFFSMNALRPITKVVHQAQKITASNLHLRIDKGKNDDEIAELAVTFNDMLLRLESSFERQKNFVANASHELRTPLTSIIGELQVFLSKDRNADEYKEALQSVLNDAEQMKDLTAGLLQIAQIEEFESAVKMDDVRLDELLIEVVEEWKKENQDSTIQLRFENLPEDESWLIRRGNRALLDVAMQNLLRNAIKFSENKPVEVIFIFSDDKLEIKFKDQGIGIEREEIQNIFQPFYRSPKARGFSGHGIGLALVEKICKIHHVFIEVQSVPGQGTTMALVWKKSF